ncbi:hypothetical protein XENOCAPTIV_025109 [Xenoophorus captivus]|uniref:Uncharacterized protein n=1 Tax=Xenoophorus captivus TaxID=1517983 RepID=A0ABV0RAA6_9TELE
MCHVLLRVPVLGAHSVDRRDPNVTPQSVGGSAARPVAVVRPWKDETFPWHHLFGMPRRSSGIHSLKREETGSLQAAHWYFISGRFNKNDSHNEQSKRTVKLSDISHSNCIRALTVQ